MYFGNFGNSEGSLHTGHWEIVIYPEKKVEKYDQNSSFFLNQYLTQFSLSFEWENMDSLRLYDIDTHKYRIHITRK